MNKRYFKDFYGDTACIAETRNGYRLTVSAGGRRHWNKVYVTYRGARIAMGRMGDCWREVPPAR